MIWLIMVFIAIGAAGTLGYSYGRERGWIDGMTEVGFMEIR